MSNFVYTYNAYGDQLPSFSLLAENTPSNEICFKSIAVLVRGEFKDLDDLYHINSVPRYLTNLLRQIPRRQSCNHDVKFVHRPIVTYWQEKYHIEPPNIGNAVIVDEYQILGSHFGLPESVANQKISRDNLQSYISSKSSLPVETLPEIHSRLLATTPRNDRGGSKFDDFIGHYEKIVGGLIEQELQKKGYLAN